MAVGALLFDWLTKPARSSPRAAWAEALEGLHGSDPLPWWAAGLYESQARHQLLRLRDDPTADGIEPWLTRLLPQLENIRTALAPKGLVVPVPSWKRHANPLPALLAQGVSRRLGWKFQPTLLRRSRPVLGQHHLGRRLRLANQAGAFVAQPALRLRQGPRPPVLLIDDILTTGATACAAAEALRQAGWRVLGLACLARTPPGRRRGRDLRSGSRQGDGPG